MESPDPESSTFADKTIKSSVEAGLGTAWTLDVAGPIVSGHETETLDRPVMTAPPNSALVCISPITVT